MVCLFHLRVSTWPILEELIILKGNKHHHLMLPNLVDLGMLRLVGSCICHAVGTLLEQKHKSLTERTIMPIRDVVAEILNQRAFKVRSKLGDQTNLSLVILVHDMPAATVRLSVLSSQTQRIQMQKRSYLILGASE